MYYFGKGIKIDNKEAFKWFEKSANQGNADAQNKLGRMYEYGIEVTQDYKKAFKWYEKSAIQGNSVQKTDELGHQ